MKTLPIQAVMITDGTNYIIHGTNEATPSELFKALAPVWSLDPSKETVHYLQITINIPDNVPAYQSLIKPQVEDNRMELTLNDCKLG